MTNFNSDLATQMAEAIKHTVVSRSSQGLNPRPLCNLGAALGDLGPNPTTSCPKCKERLKELFISLTRFAQALRTPAQIAASNLPWRELELASRQKLVVSKLADVARELRSKADGIERELARFATPVPSRFALSYAGLVGSVLHDVLWMVPNLGLDTAVQDAARVDLLGFELEAERVKAAPALLEEAAQ